MEGVMNSHWSDLEERVISLVTARGQQLPPEDVEFAEPLVRAGEYGVALEHLATQMDEYDIEIVPEIYQEIVSLGTVMELYLVHWIIKG